MKQTQPVKVININKHGERFDPAGYIVRREENPEIYRLLENWRNRPHGRP